MSKRFIDTGIFDDDWFMDLSKDAKLLWVYFITKCDHAGIIKLNEKLCKVQTDIKDLNLIIKQLGNRLVTVSEHLYFIPKFIEFQYPGFPNSKVRQQISAVDILTKYGLFDKENLTLTKQLDNSYEHDTVNDTVIVNDNEHEKKLGKNGNFTPPSLSEVETYFEENGYKCDIAIRAFNYYDSAGWKDSKGNQVRNWKQKMIAVWFKDENKIIVNNDDLEYEKLTQKLYGKPV